MAAPTNINEWCTPLHHSPEGAIDPSHVTLSSPFVAVISGASEGIGLGIAISFAKAGASDIVIASRSAEKLEAAKAKVLQAAKNPETKVLTIPCDVTKEEDIKSFAEQVAKKFEHVDCLVLTAGKGSVLLKNEEGKKHFPRSFTEAPLQNVRDQFELNVLATWTLCRYFLPMVEKASGNGPQSIVYIGSAAAHYMNSAFMAASYSLSKFASTRLIEHVHDAHHKKGVNAYVLQPGGVMTQMAAGGLPDGPDWAKRMIDSPELAGGFIVWLVKERRDWLSGRYLDARWDVDELLKRREKIEGSDLLKLRIVM